MALRPVLLKVIGDNRQAKRTLHDTERALKQTKRRLDKIGKGLGGLNVATAAAGAAMFGAARDSLSFGEALTKVTTQVGVARDAVEAMSPVVMKLAKDSGEAAPELADALFQVTSAGFRGKAALDVLEKSAQGAAIGLGSAEVVANAATNALNGYGAANLSAAEAVDTLVATVEQGKASAEEMAPVFGQLIPQATELGVEFRELGAGIAFLTRTTGNAALAGTQLRGVLTAVTKPSDIMAKSLEKMGTNINEVRRTIDEKGLLKGLLELRDLADENGVEMSSLFGRVEGSLQ